MVDEIDKEQTLEKSEEEEASNEEESTEDKNPSYKKELLTSNSEEHKEVVEDTEPPKRFPQRKEEQSPIEKQLGYITRKLQKLEQARMDTGDDDGTGDDINSLDTDDDKPLTRREMEEMLEQKERSSMSSRMVDDFLRENPNYANVSDKLRRYVNDPDYSNIPIGFIASGIVGADVDKEANRRAMEKINADKEASKTRSGGSSRRAIPGKKVDIWSMSQEEFRDYTNQALGRNRG